MLNQRGLDLNRRNPLATDFEHVVRAPGVPVIAVRILIVLVPGMDPVTVYRVFGFLMLVPVVRGDAVTANQEITDFARLDCVAMFIGEQGFIAGHKLAGAARPDIVRAVANEDMQNLGAANTIQNIHPKSVLPATQDLARQRLSSGNTNAHGRKVETLLGFGQGQHVGVKRGRAVEDGRAILLDYLEHIFSQGPSGIIYRAGPDVKGEIEVVAQSIGEI